jgi:hypothetical protein
MTLRKGKRIEKGTQISGYDILNCSSNQNPQPERG